MSAELLQDVAVVDYGAYSMRAGSTVNYPAPHASVHEPRFVTRTEVLPTGVEAPSTEASPTIVEGAIAAWDQFESLLDRALYSGMAWRRGEEGSLVMTEALLTSRDSRERLTQLMFEGFNVTGLFLQDQATCSLYAAGKLTGVVVDIGHDKTDIGAVVDGALQASSAQRCPHVGVRHLAHSTAAAMGRRLPDLRPLSPEEEMFLFRRAVLAAQLLDGEGIAAAAAAAPQEQEFTLPDGCRVRVGGEAAEAISTGLAPTPGQPSLCQRTTATVWEAGDAPLRKQVWEHALVCGGGSGIPGITERIIQDLGQMAPLSVTPAACACPGYMPPGALQHSAWAGAAILAKGLLQQGHFMTKADYEEHGPPGVHLKG